MYYRLLSIVIITLATAQTAQADLMRDMSKQLQYLSQRQNVIAQNIANANTPDFKAKELESPNMGRKRLSLATTSSKHLQGIGSRKGGNVIEDPNVRGETLDGNTVEIEDQMVKMNQNAMDYRATVGLMAKVSNLMKTAIGDGGR